MLDYYNWKKFHSIVVQIICDVEKILWNFSSIFNLQNTLKKKKKQTNNTITTKNKENKLYFLDSLVCFITLLNLCFIAL